MDTWQRILEFLSAQAVPLAAKTIASNLGLTKKIINPILYSHEGKELEKTDDSIPHWRIRQRQEQLKYLRNFEWNHSLRDTRSVRETEVHLFAIRAYHPRRGGHNAAHNEYDAWLLQLKKGSQEAVRWYADEMTQFIVKGVPICTVPSHRAGKCESGIRKVAVELGAKGWNDASSTLERTETIKKLTNRGARADGIHLQTVQVADPQLIRGREVLILDDVTTTGGSLYECAELLLEAGASSVVAVALGRTT